MAARDFGLAGSLWNGTYFGRDCWTYRRRASPERMNELRAEALVQLRETADPKVDGVVCGNPKCIKPEHAKRTV